MGWSEATITLDGIALVTELINGGKLKITRAEISENTVDAAALALQKTVLSPLNVPVVIAQKEKRENSLNICVQIHNTGAVGNHRMRQLGLYAQTETSEEKLFALLQNGRGEEIPTEDEYPQFLLEFTAVITVFNADNISVTIEPASVIVTKDMLDSALANKADRLELPTTLPANGGNADTVNGHMVNSDVPAGAKFTDTTYGAVTQSANGLMSAADKKKLDGIAENANKYAHPTTAGNKHIPAGGSSGQILRWSADGTAAWGADSDHTYSAMTGATASAAGKTGLVPAPAKGAQANFLRGDGTWAVPNVSSVVRMVEVSAPTISGASTPTSAPTLISDTMSAAFSYFQVVVKNSISQSVTFVETFSTPLLKRGDTYNLFVGGDYAPYMWYKNGSTASVGHALAALITSSAAAGTHTIQVRAGYNGPGTADTMRLVSQSNYTCSVVFIYYR